MNNNNNYQLVDLSQAIKSSRVGAPPVVLNIAVVRNAEYTEFGPMERPERNEQYVLFSALSPELQQQIIKAVNVLLQR